MNRSNQKKMSIFQIIINTIVLIIFSLICILLLTTYNPNFIGEDSPKNENAGTDSGAVFQFDDGRFPHQYKIISPPLPESLYFCGERVPLENYDVHERLDREIVVNTYWHSSMVFFIKRSNRWFPLIEPILKKNGIPEDMKYVALIESDLLNVVSPAQAVGFWQFVKSAAIEYGLEVSESVDERYNVEKATEAACRYLKKAKAKFGSWTLAAASYNMGIKGVERQLERQKTKNYYNLVLNPETSRYMFRILAVRTILSDPSKYGFDIKNEDLYFPIETYEINITTSIDDLADWAFMHDINYKILKDLNPWLRTNYLKNPTGKVYKIKLPKVIDETILIKED